MLKNEAAVVNKYCNTSSTLKSFERGLINWSRSDRLSLRYLYVADLFGDFSNCSFSFNVVRLSGTS